MPTTWSPCSARNAGHDIDAHSWIAIAPQAYHRRPPPPKPPIGRPQLASNPCVGREMMAFRSQPARIRAMDGPDLNLAGVFPRCPCSRRPRCLSGGAHRRSHLELSRHRRAQLPLRADSRGRRRPPGRARHHRAARRRAVCRRAVRDPPPRRGRGDGESRSCRRPDRLLLRLHARRERCSSHRAYRPAFEAAASRRRQRPRLLDVGRCRTFSTAWH